MDQSNKYRPSRLISLLLLCETHSKSVSSCGTHMIYVYSNLEQNLKSEMGEMRLAFEAREKSSIFIIDIFPSILLFLPFSLSSSTILLLAFYKV